MMRSNKGFTLLELSIVVVIIGALIGAVVVGQSMRRASKIRTMLSEEDSYAKAIGEFQDKFQALPGDMKGTGSFTPEAMWGRDPCGCPCATSATKTKATCNGDGNGSIGAINFTSGTNASTNPYEWFRAWQHLSNAGFIAGQFTGSPGPSTSNAAVPRQNVPSSGMASAGWLLSYLSCASASTVCWPDIQTHVLIFGGSDSSSILPLPVLTAEEAYAIDVKMDDGLPGLGRIRAWRTAYLPNCTLSDTTQAGQAYNSAGTSNTCSLVFLLGF